MGRFQQMSTSQRNKDLFKFDSAQFVCQGTLLHDFEVIDKTMVKLSWVMSESHHSTSFSMLLQAFCSRSYPVFDASEAAYLAIRKDAASPLDVILDQRYSSTGANENLGSLLFALLQRSILYDSRRCIEGLLSRIRSLKFWANDGTTKFHQLRASLALSHKLNCGKRQKACAQDFPDCADCDASCQDLVIFLLRRFQPQELLALIEKDSSECLHLHNAATSGLAKTCKIYLDYMQDDRYLSVSAAAHAILCRDSKDKKANSKETTHESNLQCVLDAFLPIAIMYDFAEIAELLLTHHANVNGVGTCGETALYVAAQFGRETFLKRIFNSGPLHSVAINLSESVRGWTPLIIACVGGFMPTVNCLLEAGADPEHCDYSGWTAQEHAAFRGHFQIAELLAIGIGPLQRERPLSSSLKPVTRHEYHRDSSKTHLSVVLGSPNMRDHKDAVALNPRLLHHAYSAQSHLSCILEIVVDDTSSGSGISRSFQMPLLDDMIYDPWKFTVQDPSTRQLELQYLSQTEQ
ncbi:Glycerophosphocholine phosphodiesterase [Xylographa soralifera]|nr:Glycerophosphocholine phosphodiesterase [Xylographa soralifera]